jgi:hypothetical protein
MSRFTFTKSMRIAWSISSALAPFAVGGVVGEELSGVAQYRLGLRGNFSIN